MRHGVLTAFFVLLALAASRYAQAHDTPVQLPPPQSAGEAWNVIEQSSANVAQLLDARLMRDIAGQLANISIALRYLNSEIRGEQSDQVRGLTATLIAAEGELLRDSRDSQDAAAKTRPAWNQWRQSLRQLESLYAADVVGAEVYICPMHPLDRHSKMEERCSICGMSLVRRHLPASAVYQKPGEPTLKMTASCPPLIVGHPAKVTIHLAKPDGSPVQLADLIEVHTKKIHLLINDRGLDDYRHEHPVPAQTAGDYEFAFTPGRPGPYRIWADLVPADSGIQEYVITDIPADTPPERIFNRETRLTAMLDGRRYELAINTGGGPIRAGQTYIGTIAVTAEDGKPFTQLEPIMGAFAHLVGFCEDGKIVLHIHPSGKEPSGPEDRAGPAFAFKFYAPAPGFLRLYCQVQIQGAQVFVPFSLTIAQ